ncbi:cellulose biosynthesis protein BcsP [Paraburkholderia fungorum]
MSSSSDIEKLFDHFGGDASAYQEIGRENEARSARTRWPLLVTLDLTQPAIPAIGQRSEASPRALPKDASREAVDPKDTTPKDAASVTRAKAPLFTRSHRRDIPPVVVATPSAAPQGASRFGTFETEDDSAARAALDAAGAAPVPPVVAQAAPLVHVAPVPPVIPVASVPPAVQFRAPAASARPIATPAAAAMPAAAGVGTGAPASASNWAPAPAPARAYASAPAAPAAPASPASILGKLFAAESKTEPAPPQPAAPAAEAAPLQAVFDRLRGSPGQTFARPDSPTRAAVPAPSNSWLVNGPRRS